jgi:RNA polymerase sporulation-specific sigma factor
LTEAARDTELVLAAQAGQTEAIAALVERLSPLVRSRAKALLPVAGASLGFEDLFQEGMLGLVRSVASYRAEGGATFRSFAFRCVQNAMLSALRRVKHEMHDSLRDDVSEIPSEDGTPESLFAHMSDFDGRFDELCAFLSPLEKKILLAKFDGGSYEAIAEKLHVTPKAVDNAIQRVRRKVRQMQVEPNES